MKTKTARPKTPFKIADVAPKILLQDSAIVRFRGSICFHCQGRLLTNEAGTICRHENGSPYMGCIQSQRRDK